MGVVVNTLLRQQIVNLGFCSFLQQCYIGVASKAIVVVILWDDQIVWLFRLGWLFRWCDWGSKWYTFHPAVEVINRRGFRNIWDRLGSLSSSGGSLLLLCSSWRWARWGSSRSFHSRWWTFWRSNRGLCEQSSNSLLQIRRLVGCDLPDSVCSQKLRLLLDKCGAERNHGLLEVFLNLRGSLTHHFSFFISFFLHSLHMYSPSCLKLNLVWVCFFGFEQCLLNALGFLLLTKSFFLNPLHFTLCWRDVFRSFLYFLLFLRCSLFFFNNCHFFDNSLLGFLFFYSFLDSKKELAQITANRLSFFVNQAICKLNIQVRHFFWKIFELIALHYSHVFCNIKFNLLIS